MHRLTIYWKIQGYRVHAIQVCDGLPLRISLNGEQYVDVTDEQLERLQDYERQGLLEFRHKQLAVIKGELQPIPVPGFTNSYKPINHNEL